MEKNENQLLTGINILSVTGMNISIFLILDLEAFH